ncbi:TonB-dependent receptor [Reichenbachiella carrageenanivorans]|uniref:TonB-dependent receptor n=1 Tax=Reichenbachiella carrageenanivorans TaxID=2979869 RepID=A0ABY6D4G0_9BACT|nr:TonB-dependent receptor [Reichenbachiella carrageenanivorans]UXX81036.1 TonB-dependent receptor [Reichenbachiella carrageenanivorans]
MKQTITYVFALVFLGCLSISDAWGQERTVRGKVTDDAGEGLPGATVIISGQTNGAVTDLNGEYSLSVPGEGGELIFSFIGYEDQNQSIGNRSIIDVQMVESASQLSEVVVVGYGSQEKGKVTGSISTVDAKNIENLPAPSFDQAIQGQIAGVNIQSSSGAPGAAMSIKIRGQNSVNLSSQPLYIVDGMIISGNDDVGLAGGRNQGGINIMSTLNSNDIESVTVLKDIASAAIYGARAGNGVIVITTKKGGDIEPKLNFNAYYGVQNLRNKLDLATGDEYRAHQLAAGSTYPSLTNNVNTDWQDELFVGGTDASVSSEDLSISGGTENTSYFVSINHYKNNGIILNTGMERLGIRANTETTYGILKWGNNMYVSNTNVDRMANSDATPLSLAVRMPSNITLYDDNNVGGFGGPDGDDSDQVKNPVGIQELNSASNNRLRVVGNTYLELELLEGLKLRNNFGFDVTSGYSRFFSPTWNSGTSPSDLSLIEYRSDDRSWLYDGTLSYDKSMGDHSFGIMAGFSAQEFSFKTLGASTIPSVASTPVSGANSEVSQVDGNEYTNTIASYFGRVNYSFRDKYIFQAVIRRDGISKFNDGYKWGTFPSLSAAWRVGDEGFMDAVPVISDMKLRASYGQAGNANVGAYAAQNTLNSQARYVLNGSQTVVGTTMSNERTAQSLSWETVTEWDLGLDFGLFDNKLILNVDYYNKETSDLLLRGAVPSTTGFGQFLSNVGSMTNKGFDFTALYQTKIGDLDLTFNGNLGIVNNEITTLADGNDILSNNWGGINQSNRVIQREGEEAGSFYGLIFDGLYQADEVDGNNVVIHRAGTPKFKDVSGPDGNPDGVIDNNDNVILGSPIPDFTYGFGMNAQYKGFDFALSFYGMSGNEIFSTTKFNQIGFYRTYNVGSQAMNAWTPTNTNTDVPRADLSDAEATDISSRWVEDGSFLRLKNVQLGYTFNPEAFGGTFSRLRVYVSGNNLLVFSKYDDWGYDPEVGAGGLDEITYPQATSFVAGINVQF